MGGVAEERWRRRWWALPGGKDTPLLPTGPRSGVRRGGVVAARQRAAPHYPPWRLCGVGRCACGGAGGRAGGQPRVDGQAGVGGRVGRWAGGAGGPDGAGWVSSPHRRVGIKPPPPGAVRVVTLASPAPPPHSAAHVASLPTHGRPVYRPRPATWTSCPLRRAPAVILGQVPSPRHAHTSRLLHVRCVCT